MLLGTWDLARSQGASGLTLQQAAECEPVCLKPMCLVADLQFCAFPAGKSTLLDSLIGANLLPANNVPESARIVCIIADASLSEPQLTDRSTGAVITGERAVRDYIKTVNSEVRHVPTYSYVCSWPSRAECRELQPGCCWPEAGMQILSC